MSFDRLGVAVLKEKSKFLEKNRRHPGALVFSSEARNLPKRCIEREVMAAPEERLRSG
jgi:hypothetical protein